MSEPDKPLPEQEKIMMKSGTELAARYKAGQMWTDKDGNIVNYDWLATKYLKPGGRLDQLAPKVGNSFDRKQLAQVMYDELTSDEMRDKYHDHQTNGDTRSNLIQREARMVYFLEYLGILKKKEGRTGIFTRTKKADQVQAVWGTVPPPAPEALPVMLPTVILPEPPATDDDRRSLLKAHQHHRSEEAFHRATADALAKVLGLER